MARTHEIYEISVTDREQLDTLLRSPKTPQSLAQRAKIIVLSAQGKTVEAVSEETGVSSRSIYKWRRRFKAAGLDGLRDSPRPGQPTKITEAKVKEVLRLTVECIPHEATHWSLRLMAKCAKLTVWQVQRIWEAADLKPHRLKSFKISNDPQFADKVVDVVGLYLDPPDKAMVLCVDEKTQIQALDRTQPLLPLKPGQIERRTHDYKRHGTTSLYAAFDILSGNVMGRLTQRHRAKEFLDFLRQIDRATPKDLDLHLVLDNSSTHKTAEVRTWLEGHPRFRLHFTPTSASWLNAVEGWFGQLERRALYRGVFSSVKELRDEIQRYIRVHNAKIAKPLRWTKSAASILDAVSRARQSALTEVTNQTGH